MSTSLKKTINHEWSVLCSYSLLEKESNNLSLINVIEQVAFDVQLEEGKSREKEIAIPTNMVIVSRFRKVDSIDQLVKASMKIDFSDPENNVLGSFEQEIEMMPDVKNIRMRSGINGLKFTESGLYHFRISLKFPEETEYSEVYSLPLEVNLNIN